MVKDKSEADLEVELAEAKAAYRDNLDDEQAKQRLHEAKQAIIAARQSRRLQEGVTVSKPGGDAFRSGDGNEG